jgi:hypothetical protein
MANTDSSWAITLPSFAPPVGNVIEQGNQQHERVLEKQYAMQQQANQKKEQDKRWQINQANDATNPKERLTGKALWDNKIITDLGDVQKQLYADIDKGISDVELEQKVNNLLTPKIQTYNYFNSKLNQIDETAKQLIKQRPDLDIEKATEVARQMAYQNMIDPNTGQFKPSDKLALDNSNELANLLSPENDWKFVKGQDALFSTIAKGEGGEEMSFFKETPQGQTLHYKGVKPIWRKSNATNPILGRGVDPKFELEGENQVFTDANGQQHQAFVVPKSTVDAVLKNDANKSQFNSLFNQYVQQLPAPPATYQDLDILKRDFLGKLIEQHDKNQPRATTLTAAPRTTVNVDMGGVEKKKKDDYDLVASLARTFNNPSSINTNTLTKTELAGYPRPVYNLTGVFQNLKIRGDKEFDEAGNAINKDINMDGVYIDPSNNSMVLKFPTNEDAEKILGQKFNKKDDKGKLVSNGTVVITSENKDAMQTAINSIATAYKFKENERKKLIGMVKGVEPKKTVTKSATIKYNGYDYSEKEILEAGYPSVEAFKTEHKIK